MNNFANWLLNNILDPLVGWLDSYLKLLAKLPLMYYQIFSVAISALLVYGGIVSYEVSKVVAATAEIPAIVTDIYGQGHGGDLTATEADLSDALAAINTFFPLDEFCAMMVTLANLYVILLLISIAASTIRFARGVILMLAEAAA